MLLHKHPKLGLWLPCGGHIEPNELPDDAAVRECLEETGVAIELVGERALEVHSPRQLVRPRGVQLEPIIPGHEHIDLVYYGIPEAGYGGKIVGEHNDFAWDFAWYSADAWRELELTEEVRAWLELAEREIPQHIGEDVS